MRQQFGPVSRLASLRSAARQHFIVIVIIFAADGRTDGRLQRQAAGMDGWMDEVGTTECGGWCRRSSSRSRGKAPPPPVQSARCPPSVRPRSRDRRNNNRRRRRPASAATHTGVRRANRIVFTFNSAAATVARSVVRSFVITLLDTPTANWWCLCRRWYRLNAAHAQKSLAEHFGLGVCFLR